MDKTTFYFDMHNKTIINKMGEKKYIVNTLCLTKTIYYLSIDAEWTK